MRKQIRAKGEKNTINIEISTSNEDFSIQSKNDKSTQTDLEENKQMNCNLMTNLILFFMFLFVGIMIEIFLNIIFKTSK
jgi:hypothetical protein